jgi:translation initiation factor 1
MRPEPKKRIDTNAAESSRPLLNAAFSGLDLPDLPAALEVESLSPERSAPPAAPGKIWKMGRVVLRRETARRGGKTVIVAHDFATHLPQSIIDSVAKKIRAACGCGGTVKDRTIEIQGDQPARIRAALEAEGFQVAGVH